MTVPELDFHPTDSLVNLSKFYPAEIHVPHHQLRNFISTVYDNKIFFVHNHDIFVIDLQKQQRSLIATVPFEARCLAANHGWICVGGETKGDCAFVRIGEGNTQVGQYGHDLIVDMLGKDIVNSMTIHRVRGKHASQPDETVVLISNNDKNVTLYSLTQQEVLCVLTHPVPMNYASMSPDCTIIAAVGDSNEVYFYRRQDADNEEEKGQSLFRYQEYDWRRLAVPDVPAGEGVGEDYSFAVAFSPSGHLCAVSAQGGAISIFDVGKLVQAESNAEAENAVICTFKSSRSSLWGCVRSLCFSPEPWDLLAWTEDHGVIGVADIRQAFVRRQCVSLDRDATEVVELENVTSSEYHNMDVKDRLKHQYMHRMRALRRHTSLGATSHDATHRGTGSEESLDLDARERSVLDALETTIDDVEHYSLRPYSVNYNTRPNARLSVSSSEQSREYNVQLLNPGARIQEAQMPRRRQSVVLSESTPGRHLSPPETSRAVMTASPAQMSEDNTTPPMSTNDLTPSNTTSSQPLPYNIPPSDSWHVIEAQLIANRANARNQPGLTVASEHPVSLAQIESAIYAERQFSNRLERQLADERRLAAMIRSELDSRNRAHDARQQELEAAGLGERSASPSLEYVLLRQLENEQENGRQRTNEIENEIVSNSQRVERLMLEREHLLLRAMATRDGTSLSSTAGGSSRSNSRSNNSMELDTLLRQMEEERRVRRQRLTDLELQVRRAESSVEIASANSILDIARDRGERVSDARFLTSAGRSGQTATSLRRAQQMDQYGVPYGSRATPSTASAYANRLRTAAVRRAENTVSDARSPLPRTSELAGRVSENDMRMARSMLHAAVMDGNGNWISGHGIRRYPGHILRPNGTGILPARVSNIEAMLRESGVGTAGIGWSPDGDNLFVGSEMGIFEFKVNLRDRMQFPSLEMR